MPKKPNNVFILSIALFLLSINPVVPSGATPEDEAEEYEAGSEPFKITNYAARNPFPPDILERMRTELMVVMGIEPKEVEETDKKQKTGH